ncbi:MAG TPA: DUF4873 domain-containing protein [Mycobacterium sp.]|nr:DUF4873 domain-containing protein [Mycobacterium sp.]
MSGNDTDRAAAAGDVIVVGDTGRTHGRFPGAAIAGATTAIRFDSGTDTWTVTAADGSVLTARVVVDTTSGGDGVVAVHGRPNYFRIPGPHTARQARYLAGLIDRMRRGGSTRIEARSRVRVHRLLPTRGLSRFYLSGPVGVDDEIYDGPAVLAYQGQDRSARVRLTGHFDPIDGQYHWQGMLYANLPADVATGSRVVLRIGEHAAAARISEQTPWGTLAVVGEAGYPPFPLEDVEISMPPRV